MHSIRNFGQSYKTIMNSAQTLRYNCYNLLENIENQILLTFNAQFIWHHFGGKYYNYKFEGEKAE